MGAAFSLPSAPIEAQTLQLSDSEDLDVVSANAMYTEDSPPQSHAYDELVEVVSSAVEIYIKKEVSIGQQRKEDIH